MTVVREKLGERASSAVAVVGWGCARVEQLVVGGFGAEAGSPGQGWRGLRPGVWPLEAGGRGRTSQFSRLASVH